jgi:hypothetical protein
MEEEQRSIVTITPTGKIARVISIEGEVDKEESCNRSKFALLAPPSETSQDEIEAMLEIETNHYSPPMNYLAFDSCKSGVNENWRRRLCEWMFEVTDHYDFDREVVSFAFDYLDRSISLAYGPTSRKKLSKKEYQLYAVTSLYLAIKVHGEMDSDDGKRIKLRISAFQELSRGCFKTETIEAKEIEFLALLQWRVNPPTCARCIYSYLHLLPEWTSAEFETPREDIICHIFDVAKYLTELSIFVSEFSFNYSPSTIAYGAIICAIDYVEESIMSIPSHIKARFLLNIKEVSSNLTPESEDIRCLRTMLKKLAPKMFTNCNHHHPLPRTVSLLEVDSAKSVATASRSISPIVMGADEPEPKRQKV